MDDLDVEFSDAIVRGDLVFVQSYVETGRIDINTPDRDGDFPLHLAVKKNQHAIVDYLLQCEVWIDAMDEHGWTALHEAALLGAEDIVRTLLKWNVDKTIRNQDDMTALDVAVLHGHGPVVFLLCNGHDPTVGFF